MRMSLYRIFRPTPRVLPALLAACVSLLVLGGCSSSEDGAEQDSGAASDAPAFLSLGSAPPGGTFYIVGGAIADVLTTSEGVTWRVTNESTKGSRENIRRLTSGDLDVALSNAAITYSAVRGAEGWDQAHDVKAIATLAPNVALFVTPASSGVKRMADLRGKRVVIGPAGAGFEYFVGPILEEHGLSYDDLEVLNNTQTGAVDMLADGSAAAAFLGGAVPTASITQASGNQDLLFVPFDEEAKIMLLGKYPFFFPATIPADTYRGQGEAYEGLNVGSMHLIARADLDADSVYKITKTLWENRTGVVERHAAGKAINEKNVTRATGTEFHEGAVRFYREIGFGRKRRRRPRAQRSSGGPGAG